MLVTCGCGMVMGMHCAVIEGLVEVPVLDGGKEGGGKDDAGNEETPVLVSVTSSATWQQEEAASCRPRDASTGAELDGVD